MTSSKSVWWAIVLGLVAIIIWLVVFFRSTDGGRFAGQPPAPAPAANESLTRTQILESLQSESSPTPVASLAERQALIKTLGTAAAPTISAEEQAQRRAEILKTLNN